MLVGRGRIDEASLALDALRETADTLGLVPRFGVDHRLADHPVATAVASVRYEINGNEWACCLQWDPRMNTFVRQLPVFAITTMLVSTGCLAVDEEPNSDDAIWLPPAADGKADGAANVLDGSTIPSQFVDPSRDYMRARPISTLKQVGALTGLSEAVAIRADGIIANLPADGRLDAAELVRLESPEIFSSLFPDEQDVVSQLWSHLEMPSESPIPFDARPGPELPTAVVVAPAGLTEPQTVAISSLPVELRSVAQRVQLVANLDGDATSIRTSEIDQVLANPAAFTTDEVAQLGAIKGIFHVQAVSTGTSARLIMSPNAGGITTTALGTLSLSHITSAALWISRSRSVPSSGPPRCRGVADFHHVSTLRLGGVAGSDKIVVVNLENLQSSTVFGNAELLEAEASAVVIERYVGGQRVEAHHTNLPKTYKSRVADMSAQLNFQVEFSDNSPVPGYVDGAWKSGSESTSVVVLGKRAPYPRSYDISAFNDSFPDRIHLPVGAYATPELDIGVEIYPKGVIFLVKSNGEKLRMMQSAYVECYAATASDANFEYSYAGGNLSKTERNTVEHRSWYATLTPAHRVR